MTGDREVRIVTKWRHFVFRKYLRFVPTKTLFKWTDGIIDRWTLLVVELMIGHTVSKKSEIIFSLKHSIPNRRAESALL